MASVNSNPGEGVWFGHFRRRMPRISPPKKFWYTDGWQVEGRNEQTLLSQLSQLHQAVAKSSTTVIKDLAADGLDLGMPLRSSIILSAAWMFLSKILLKG
jgi:hypothetical protein